MAICLKLKARILSILALKNAQSLGQFKFSYFSTAWEDWPEWSDCSTWTTCGLGISERTRTCSGGGQAGTDRLCKGPEMESKQCQQPNCGGMCKVLLKTFYRTKID